jgi:hypothetical protein
MKTLIPAICLTLFLFPGFAACFVQDPSPSPPAVNTAFEDSAAGLQHQLQTFLGIIRSGDQSSVQSILDSFAIPNTASWFPAHFEPNTASQLSAAYSGAFAGARSHIWWATGNFAQFADFSYLVAPSELPPPIADTGFESLLPRPTDPPKIENFRISSTSSDPTHGPPSWVNSFIYLDGRFRWIGGTYPFWDEGLTALRGPMSLPPATLHGRVVQAIAFHNDQKNPAIDGIVQVEIKVERDGHISRIKVRSGDKQFIEDAKAYLNAARFPAVPDDVRLLNEVREWPVEVVFFTQKAN